MSEEVIPEISKVPEIRKAKRDIIRFTGEKPTAINLEHVTSMYLDGKKITFEFYTKAHFVDCVDEHSAKDIFEIILTTWSSDVLE